MSKGRGCMRGRTLGAWSPPSSPPPSGQRGTQCAKERTDAWRHLGSPLQETGQKNPRDIDIFHSSLFCSLVKKQSTEWAFVTRSSSLFFLSVDRSFTHEAQLQIQLHISHLLPPSPVSIASLFQNVSPRPIHPSNT